jgi:hypothetical protein
LPHRRGAGYVLPMIATAVTFYDVVLWVHITAVVLAYPVFLAVAERTDPRSLPAVARGILAWDRIGQGLLVVILLAGIYMVADGPWELSDFYVGWGFLAVIVVGGLSGGFFTPKTQQLIEIAERDLAASAASGGEARLSDEFQALSGQVAKVGTGTGIFLLLTIYVMTAKPFLSAPARPRAAGRADRHGDERRRADGAADRDVRLGGRRADGPARMPGLAARGELPLPRRQRQLPLRDQARPRAAAAGDRQHRVPARARTVRSYCVPLKRAEVDTVILGCTHYPLVAPMLQRMLGRDVQLVTAGHAIAAEAQRLLDERGLGAPRDGEGSYDFLTTGEVESFRELGTRFLQMPLGEVEKVRIRSD